jgi:hypothetical protein
VVTKGLIVGAAALVAIVLAVGGASEPVEVPEANVAACSPSETTIGSGPANWRRGSMVAGPVAVARQPLRKMFEANGGQLYTKMGLLVAGHQYVVLSVPLALRERVFLYYGRILDGEGHRTTSLLDAPGYSETEFQPCRDKPRTIWPGGIRVTGSAPVNLLVTVEGRSTSVPLPLGRPVVYGRR